jgi:DNA polymerase III epsilon subunit-like protein
MRLFIGDTETTGLEKDRKACDLALMEIDEDLNILGTAEALLNPGKPIDPTAAEIHGISDEMVKDCPTFEEWLQDTFGGTIDGDAYLIGYRVAFDEPMLKHCFTNFVKSWDVLPLVQKMFPDLENHKLQTLRAHLQLEGGTAHRAMGDVVTTHQALLHMIPRSGRSIVQHVKTPFEMVHRMPWGKHKGLLLAELPKGYREWLSKLDLDPNLRRSLELVGAADYQLNLKKGTSK